MQRLKFRTWHSEHNALLRDQLTDGYARLVQVRVQPKVHAIVNVMHKAVEWGERPLRAFQTRLLSSMFICFSIGETNLELEIVVINYLKRHTLTAKLNGCI
jgi:hypothetical protein